MNGMHEPGACHVCGDPTKAPDGPTCGGGCSHIWNGWRVTRDALPNRIGTCGHCGKVFKAKNCNHKAFCSRDCAFAANARRPKPKRKPVAHIRVCLTCGDSFTSPYAEKRYCTAECHREMLRRRQRPKAFARWRANRGDTPVRDHIRTARCEARHAKTCEQCGREFLGHGNAKYCSPGCQGAVRKALRRARRYTGEVEVVGLEYVMRRDSGRCQLCRRRVDAAKNVPHPRAPTLDHIIPLSRGGEHVRANLQLACFACNTVKGNRSAGEQLMCVG
jgi:5-methylcytosine-specific restriction endonuclease McrA